VHEFFREEQKDLADLEVQLRDAGSKGSLRISWSVLRYAAEMSSEIRINE
jgi:hypothetical protein